RPFLGEDRHECRVIDEDVPAGARVAGEVTRSGELVRAVVLDLDPLAVLEGRPAGVAAEPRALVFALELVALLVDDAAIGDVDVDDLPLAELAHLHVLLAALLALALLGVEDLLDL